MKEEILKMLKDSNGNFVSGEDLSSELGVSRAAVWKNINQLKALGYVFESASRKGYRLMESPDILSKNEICEHLNTKYTGANIIHFDSIDSTNTKAKEFASQGAPEGTLVIAEEQTAGKGRLGRHWVSPKHKGIWMSLILRPDINPVYAAKITLIGAAAVNKALEELSIKTSIKWPNDIVINGRKVCGILTEMSAELNKIHYLIMGLGINVNTELSEFPEDLTTSATSLKIETGNHVARKKIVAGILNNFENLYKEFIKYGTIKDAVAICRDNSVLLGKEVRIINGSVEKKARAVDIDDDGQLVIITEDGSTETVFSGEVSVRGLYGYV